MDIDADIALLKRRVAALEENGGAPNNDLSRAYDWIAFSDFARLTSEAIAKLTATISLLLDQVETLSKAASPPPPNGDPSPEAPA